VAIQSDIFRLCSLLIPTSGHEEERMATLQRNPRDILLETDAEYQRLAEQHRQYEAELQRISKAPYLNSEDLLEEIKLKKMKLHCKDEMERIALRMQQARAHPAQ
jgi:uncharacterized protein YdcH (DUF465 family)